MSCGYKGTVLHMYEGLFIPLDSYCRWRITYFNPLIFIDTMTICPECEKQFSAPKIAFQTGQKPAGGTFEYAICSCPNCDKCFGVIALPL